MKIYHHELSDAKEGLAITMYKSKEDFLKYVDHIGKINAVESGLKTGVGIVGSIFSAAVDIEPELKPVVKVATGLVKLEITLGAEFWKWGEHLKHILSQDNNVKPGESHEWNWESIKKQKKLDRWEFPGPYVVVTKGDDHKLLYCSYINPGGLMGVIEKNGKVFGGTQLYFDTKNESDASKNGGAYIDTGGVLKLLLPGKGYVRAEINLTREPKDDYAYKLYTERPKPGTDLKVKCSEDENIAKLVGYLNTCGGRLFEKNTDKGGMLLATKCSDDDIARLKKCLKDKNRESLFDENKYKNMTYDRVIRGK